VNQFFCRSTGVPLNSRKPSESERKDREAGCLFFLKSLLRGIRGCFHAAALETELLVLAKTSRTSLLGKISFQKNFLEREF